VKQYEELGSDRSIDENSSLVECNAVVASKYRQFGECTASSFLQHLAFLGV